MLPPMSLAVYEQGIFVAGDNAARLGMRRGVTCVARTAHPA